MGRVASAWRSPSSTTPSVYETARPRAADTSRFPSATLPALSPGRRGTSSISSLRGKPERPGSQETQVSPIYNPIADSINAFSSVSPTAPIEAPIPVSTTCVANRREVSCALRVAVMHQPGAARCPARSPPQRHLQNVQASRVRFVLETAQLTVAREKVSCQTLKTWRRCYATSALNWAVDALRASAI